MLVVTSSGESQKAPLLGTYDDDVKGDGRYLGGGGGSTTYCQKITGNFEKELKKVLNNVGKRKHPKRIIARSTITYSHRVIYRVIKWI